MPCVAPILTLNLYLMNLALTQERRHVAAASLIGAIFDISLSLACFFGIGLRMHAFFPLRLPVLLAGSVLVIAVGIDLLRTGAEACGTGISPRLPLQKIIPPIFAASGCPPQTIIDGTMLLGASRAAIPQEYGTCFIL